jgi:LmbE family N-acetylglucosaminyl deacetylase
LTSSRLKTAVLSATTALWTTAARRLGDWSGGRRDQWRSPGGQRVLVVAAHPDDEIGCAGTMLLHARAGDEVHLAHVTDGRRARTLGIPPSAMAEHRRREAQVAATRLAVAGAHWMGLCEGAWEEASLHPALGDLLRRIAPQVVYAPSCVDFHPEHVRVAAALGRVLAGEPGSGVRVRIYEIQVPLTPVLANLVAPLGPIGTEVGDIVRCYPTQVGSIARCLRMKGYAAALHGEQGSVEVFWELDAAAYARVVGEPHQSGPTPFRGVRLRPFTDPLAYLQGLDARRALRERARVQ